MRLSVEVFHRDGRLQHRDEQGDPADGRQQNSQARIAGGRSLAGAVIGRRQMYIDAARGWRDTPVYQREKLPVGIDIPGPAAVNEMSATTLFFPGQTGRIDPRGNLIVKVAS